MDRIDTMQLFARIARGGSFSRAADAHGISRSTATERISALERHLGARLLNRTRQRVALTPEGEEYLHSCERILREIEQVESTLGGRSDKPAGALRVSVNAAVGRCLLLPRLAHFLATHPGIQLEFFLSDARADFVADRIDVAVRIGGLEDQDLVCRPLGRVRRITVASPAYLERHGSPATPEELTQHRTIEFLLPRGHRNLEWEFERGGEVTQLHPEGSLGFSDAVARVDAAVAGLGIAQTLSFIARPHLEAGRLTRLFAELETFAPPISALYAPSPHVPARVRAFLDFAAQSLAPFRDDQEEG